MTDATVDTRDRMTVLETRIDATLPHLATKADVQSIKVWVLSAVLGSVVAAISAVAALLITVIRIAGV